MLVGVVSLPPSLIPSLQNIDILHHKKAKLPKHLQHSVHTMTIVDLCLADKQFSGSAITI